MVKKGLYKRKKYQEIFKLISLKKEFTFKCYDSWPGLPV